MDAKNDYLRDVCTGNALLARSLAMATSLGDDGDAGVRCPQG